MRIIIPLLLLAALAGCADREGQRLAKQTETLVTKKAKPVRLVSVQTKSLTEFIDITGDVVTSEESAVGSKVGGKLLAVYVRNGDAVSAGQLLATVDSANQGLAVQQARSQMAAAQASLNQALTNARVTPQRTAAAVEAARAQVRSAKAQLEKALRGARTEERKQADAAVAAASSNMETARKQRDRVKKLYEEGAASQQAYEQVENAYQASLNQFTQATQQREMLQNGVRPEDIESARAQVRQAEEGLRQAEANRKLDALLMDQVNAARANLDSARTQLSLAQNNLSDTQVRAPFSGHVSGNPLQAGTVIAPGTPIVRVVGKGGSYFEGAVPANSLSAIKIGSPVEISIDGMSDLAKLIGTVSSISPNASSVGRVFKVRIEMPAGAAEVRPGMFARGKVSIREVPDAKVVPSGAIVVRNDKQVVFVLDGTKVRMQPVITGIVQDGLTQVKGLMGNEQVVITGQSDLDEGTLVEPEKVSLSARNPWA